MFAAFFIFGLVTFSHLATTITNLRWHVYNTDGS